MPIQLAIDPSLQVSARQFAAGWNPDPRTDDLGTAEVQGSAPNPTTRASARW